MVLAFEVIQLFCKGKGVLPGLKGFNDPHGTTNKYTYVSHIFHIPAGQVLQPSS